MSNDLRLDRKAPVFFMSYPRVQDNPDGAVTRFFEALNTTVNDLLPLAPGHRPGFLDHTMQGGQFWEQRLLEAVGTCQVFVPLLSPRFMASPWCRFEWESFGRRTVRIRTPSGPAAASPHQAAIIPVSWTGVDPARLPPTISKVQGFSPRPTEEAIVTLYEREGVLGLDQMQMHREYRVVVWRLAQRIAEIVYQHVVDPLVPADTTGLGHSFMEDAR